MAGDNSDRMSVVIPAVSVPSTIACIRSLGAEGVHTIVTAENQSAPAFSSTYCDEAVTVPDPESDLIGYALALLGLARRDDVRTIIPVREEDAFVLSKYRRAFAEHVGTPWPTLDQLRCVHDRVQLASVAESAGVPCPQTRPLGHVTEWDKPAVIKSRYNLIVDDVAPEIAPGHTAQQKDIRYLEPGEKPDQNAVYNAFGHEPIVQTFIPGGDEYMVGALCNRGEVIAMIQHRQIRGTSYANGGGVYRECIDDPTLAATARALLEELDWHGLACIEYVYHPTTAEFSLVEVNPRMWLSVAANFRMGANFPLYYWLLATGQTNLIEPNFEVGALSHYLQGECCYLASLITDDSPFIDRPSYSSAIYEVISSCLRDGTFDLLDRSDPWPFVADFLEPLEGRLPDSVSVVEIVNRLARGKHPGDWQDAIHQTDASASSPQGEPLTRLSIPHFSK